jgi:hypothetical protein
MADLVDLSFLACSQPVLAHPLLQTSQNGYNKIEKELRNEVGKGKDEETIADEQFLDPLGASSSSPKIENSITIVRVYNFNKFINTSIRTILRGMVESITPNLYSRTISSVLWIIRWQNLTRMQRWNGPSLGWTNN